MRNWPIRRKLLVLPVVTVVLLVLTTLWLFGASRRYEHDVRAAVEAELNAHRPAAGIGESAALRAERTATDDVLTDAGRVFIDDHVAMAALLGCAFLALLSVAWFTANGFSRRLATLRNTLSPLLDRGAAPLLTR